MTKTHHFLYRCNSFVYCSGIIHKVLCMIEEVANPLISQLSSEDLLPVAQQFVALKPNITHFMLKQHEKSCKDLGQTGLSD